MADGELGSFPLQKGDVVQLSPSAKNKAFAGCFMVVTEPKPWGAQGYVQALGDREAAGDLAYYRAAWSEMVLVGKATWVAVSDE